MISPGKQNPIPKSIALILITVGVAYLLKQQDAADLAKLDSMSTAEIIQHQRALHQHSTAFHFFTFLILGGFYLGAIEFVAYLVGLVLPKKPDA